MNPRRRTLALALAAALVALVVGATPASAERTCLGENFGIAGGNACANPDNPSASACANAETSGTVWFRAQGCATAHEGVSFGASCSLRVGTLVLQGCVIL